MKMNQRYDFYWAAPLFTAAELEFNFKGTSQVESLGFKVFLPQRDNSFSKIGGSRCFKRNVLALERSDSIISICDGPDVDSGTAWEVGFAKARQTEGRMDKIILVRTDFRTASDGEQGINLMVSESAEYIFNSIAELFKYLISLKVQRNKGE